MEKKIFAIAIAVSIMVHFFWIAAIKVVTVNANEERVKFSKVSFLGPASGKGMAFELMATPKTASFLEKRYKHKVASLPVPAVKAPGSIYGRAKELGGRAHAPGNELAGMIEAALGSSKHDIAYPAEVEEY